ncbi:uncharacterized protein LOC129270560 [Lytechinus pictus]|uniref:uncharacterized protein LOC129270560 n=1 Tax=Lytechinus pictus TaxID=7653 RepID=UPI0030BA02D3
MDDYKYTVIEKVRQMPLLWDPEHFDYKNKDQRQLAWDKLESDMKPPNKGVTVKQTWEGLNRAFNSAMSRRKKKTSGSGQGNDKPWKFETSMGFLKAVKERRSTISNLEEIDDSDSDENWSRVVLEQAIDKSGIYDVHDDDNDEDNMAPSTSFRPIPHKPNSKRKATDDVYDDTQAGLYKVMTQCLEEKQTSPRLKFFESIMPQVDEMTDDCFLDFQIEVLNSLKRFRYDPGPDCLNYSQPMTPAT